jgi:hypothetical protein
MRVVLVVIPSFSTSDGTHVYSSPPKVIVFVDDHFDGILALENNIGMPDTLRTKMADMSGLSKYVLKAGIGLESPYVRVTYLRA